MADLLVDEGVGQNLVQQLRALGLRAYHALEFLPKSADDSLVFLEAQKRHLTIFSWNRDDYVLLTAAWRNWGHGDHYGLISRRASRQQLVPAQTLTVSERYCRDVSSFLNRIELF